MLAFPSPSPLSSPTKNRSRAATRGASIGNAAALGSPASEGTPALTRTAVSLEYAALHHVGHCPLGMYVTPSAETLLVWDAVFFVHQGASTSRVARACAGRGADRRAVRTVRLLHGLDIEV